MLSIFLFYLQISNENENENENETSDEIKREYSTIHRYSKRVQHQLQF